MNNPINKPMDNSMDNDDRLWLEKTRAEGKERGYTGFLIIAEKDNEGISLSFGKSTIMLSIKSLIKRLQLSMDNPMDNPMDK